jgi:hypothetical protein
MTRYAVMSDPGGDPWEEAIRDSQEDAAAEIQRVLDEIAAQGLDPAPWRQVFWVEARRA